MASPLLHDSSVVADQPELGGKEINAILHPYRGAVNRRSIQQLAVSFVAYGALWGAMYWSLSVGYWLTLLLSIPTAGFLVRLFVIQHDCGHGSFFTSQKLANAVGAVIGVMTLVPYEYWRKTHAIHHSTSGNLDLRGFGDVTTITTAEYYALTRWGRLMYRLYRNPLVMLVLGPIYQFVIKHRYPTDIPKSWTQAWRSVHRTNAALLVVLIVMWSTIGLIPFFLIQTPIIMVTGGVGVWLFYVQHQFEDTYWRTNPEWDFFEAGLKGSSYYALPRPLQWITANIGVHHIHHVNSRIPNYRLAECYANHPELRPGETLTLRDSVRCLGFQLWDENLDKMISFRDLAQKR